MKNQSKIKLITGVTLQCLGLISIHPSHQLECVHYRPSITIQEACTCDNFNKNINPPFKLINEIRSAATLIGRESESLNVKIDSWIRLYNSVGRIPMIKKVIHGIVSENIIKGISGTLNLSWPNLKCFFFIIWGKTYILRLKQYLG
jgi:hypothetical protein